MIRFFKISVTIVILLLSVFISGCNKGKGGCTDPHASNYDEDASYDDGTCMEKIHGCTDPNSYNYNPSANTDDGSCITTSQVTIWTGSPTVSCAAGGIYVYVDDNYAGYINSSFSSPPSCGASGSVTLNNVQPGTHKFYARCYNNGYAWGPHYFNVTGLCYKWKVY
ncbi:MAG: hypothetical protein K0S44_669 [Bacteroidetes bacterium]|jgi:hypothetical protein|nr:hypothetical protein [Bacteroidota bacterium]